MTDSLPLKRALLNEWLESTQKQQQARYSSLRVSSTMKRGVLRRTSCIKGLKRKVDRLANDNTQLKQCAQVLEMQQQSALDAMILKQARIAFLEEQLRLLNKDTSVLV